MGWSLQVILLRLGSKVGITLDLFLKLFLKLLLCEDSSHFKKSLPIAQQDQHPLGRPKAPPSLSSLSGLGLASFLFLSFPLLPIGKSSTPMVTSANGHKFRLNPARLVTQLCPHTPILIENYKPWVKTSQTLFCIDPAVGIDSNFKFIPTAVLKTQCFHNHFFPLFVNKRGALFYACLTILLTVVPVFFQLCCVCMRKERLQIHCYFL
jgi:hypothetical protein